MHHPVLLKYTLASLFHNKFHLVMFMTQIIFHPTQHQLHRNLVTLALLLCLLVISTAHASRLQAGPMLGHIALRGANIWIQGAESGPVTLRYWQKGQPDMAFSLDVMLQAEHHNTHTFKLANLEPGTEYRYQVLFDDDSSENNPVYAFKTQQLWMWRTDPPDFSVLAGSCNFVVDAPYDRKGKPYGGDYEIFDTVAKQEADAIFWLGDNWYYREADYDAPQTMNYRVAYNRMRPYLQPVYKKFANYAIWDDHDFGPDNSGGYFPFKDTALKIFKDYWANPSYGLPETPGVFTKVRINDADFFLLDGRYHRDNEHYPDGPDKQMFGPEQMKWLKNQLAASRQPFKIIVSGNQMLNDYSRFESWSLYRHERDAFLRWLDDNKIEGVFFLSGDRHHSELLKIRRKKAYPLYELTCSPFTAGTHIDALSRELKPILIPGSLVGEKNFCKMTFSGPRKDRDLTIEIIDKDGEVKFKTKIKQSVLTYAQYRKKRNR